MHQFKLSLFSALSLLYFSTSAQPEKGTTLLGLSSNIGGSSIIGLSYERNEVKSNLASFRDSINYHKFSYNAGVKVAYFITNRFALGADFYAGSSNSLSDNILFQSSRISYSAGPFMRYYLPSDIGILFYFEAATYLGLDFNYYHVEDIFRSTIFIEENMHFSYSSLAMGLSFPATEQLFLDFALAGNYMRSWDPDAGQFDRYTVTKGLNFKLGFSIFL